MTRDQPVISRSSKLSGRQMTPEAEPYQFATDP